VYTVSTCLMKHGGVEMKKKTQRYSKWDVNQRIGIVSTVKDYLTTR
jgi:hypothetical protein